MKKYCDNTHNILDVLALVDLIVQDAPPSCPTLPVALIDDDQDGYDDASYDAGAESCTATPSACVMTGCDDPQEPGCNYHHTATQGSFDFHAYEGGGTPIGNESYALIEAIAVCTSLSECVGIAHQWYMPDDGGWQPVSTVQVIPANYGRALIKRCQ